jgi:hypothetical protein
VEFTGVLAYGTELSAPVEKAARRLVSTVEREEGEW